MMFYIFNTSYELIATTDKINQAIHAEEINNENALLLTVTEPDYMDLLVEHNLVGFFDDDEEFQLFRIQKVEDEDNGIVTRDLYIVHIAYDLAYEYVEDKRPTGTAEAILTSLLTDSDWEVGTVADFGSSHVQFYYESIKSGIAKIIEAMGGEVRYRLTLSGSEITHKYVDILESRGSVTGKRFTYTKDIINIHRTIDMDNVITRCYGFGKGEAIENETGETSYGRRTNFNDITWTVGGGDPVDKPAGQKYVEDAGAIALYGTRTGKAIFDDETDAETILELTWDYLQINKDPVVSYELDVMLLEKLSGYSHEAVRLGDTVIVIDKAVTPEIKISARVLRFEKDLLALDQSKVVLGNFVETLTGQVRDNIKVIDRYRDREGAYDDGSMRAIDGLDESGYVGLPIHSEKIVGDDALDGLNLTNTYLGYYNLAQDAWRAYIDRLGNFLFQKDADNYFKFDGTDFEFKGPVIVTGGDATKTFTAEPTTPYKVGDLWVEGNSGDFYRCTTERLTGNYNAADWELATKYTDDSSLSTFVSEVYDLEIANLQSQIDGNITTWFYAYEPTLLNVPASDWTTDILKNNHLGDLFYDTTTGYAYRFQLVTGIYSWQKLSDSDIEAALQAASNAQDTADGKRRVFTTTPTAPYDVGDLWTQGATGDILKCKTANESDPFDSDHWELASEYTKGADWSSNLSNIPDTLGEPFDAGDNGLHLTSTYMGYYSHPNWTAFIKNDGTFLFQKDANNYFAFDGTNFTFRGPLIADDITAGDLTVGGSGGKVGSITVLDETDATIVTIDKDGILVNGTVGALGFQGVLPTEGWEVTARFYADNYNVEFWRDTYYVTFFDATYITGGGGSDGTVHWFAGGNYLQINSLMCFSAFENVATEKTDDKSIWTQCDLFPISDGDRILGASNQRWLNVYSDGINVDGVITSLVATGTAPFDIDSTTVVDNLNVDLLDGKHASAFLELAGGTMTGKLTADDLGFDMSAIVDSASTATHYYVETGSGNIVPKTLANVKSEIVTKAAVEAVLTGAITSHTHSYVPLAGGVNITGNIALTGGAAITGAGRKTIYFSTGDCNTITEEWTVIHPDVSNAPLPGTTYWYLHTIQASSGGNKHQIAYRYNNNQIYRRRYDGSWSSWIQIWTDATDGSGSGLDADLLDGYHASSFPSIVGSSSKTWDPPSISAGLATSTTFTVSGAATTDFVLLTYISSVSPLIVIQAFVESANTIRVSLANASSGAIDIGSGTWKVMVLR